MKIMLSSIVVGDQAKALKFYPEVLGLPESVPWLDRPALPSEATEQRPSHLGPAPVVSA